MPIFDFRCEKCGYLIKDEFVPAKDLNKNTPPVRKCPECDGTAKRQIGAPMFYFRRKGSN